MPCFLLDARKNKASSRVHCRCRPQIYFCKESVITSSGPSTRLICLGTESQKNPTVMPQQKSWTARDFRHTSEQPQTGRFINYFSSQSVGTLVPARGAAEISSCACVCAPSQSSWTSSDKVDICFESELHCQVVALLKLFVKIFLKNVYIHIVVFLKFKFEITLHVVISKLNSVSYCGWNIVVLSRSLLWVAFIDAVEQNSK